MVFNICDLAGASHRVGIISCKVFELRTGVVFNICDLAGVRTGVVFNICEPARARHQGGFLLLQNVFLLAIGWGGCAFGLKI